MSKGFCNQTLHTLSAVHDLDSQDSEGNTIACGLNDSHIRMFDSRSGTCTKEISDFHTSPVLSTKFSPDTMQLLSLSKECIQLLDVRTYEAISSIIPPSGLIFPNTTTAIFSPRGNFMCAGLSNGDIYVYRLNGEVETTLAGKHQSNVCGVGWAEATGNNSPFFVSCDEGCGVNLWN